MKAWMRMYVMKKVAVWGAELPSVFTMPLGLFKKAEIWLRKEPVSSVPRKVVMTCTQPNKFVLEKVCAECLNHL